VLHCIGICSSICTVWLSCRHVLQQLGLPTPTPTDLTMFPAHYCTSSSKPPTTNFSDLHHPHNGLTPAQHLAPSPSPRPLNPLQVFQPIQEGRDLIGRAKTGSGKTLAFALPVIENLLAVGSLPAGSALLALLLQLVL
jgi:hypothetical protein